MDPTDRLTTAEVAILVGVRPGTWRSYLARHQPHGNPAPEPDGQYDSRTPYWLRATIEAWMQRRPGQGARTDLAEREPS